MALLLRDVLDALFPPACIACAGPVKRGAAFCGPCADTLVDATPAAALAAYAYGGALAVAVRRAKLSGDEIAARALGRLFADVDGIAALCADVDAVAWVPAHWSRRVARGFDLPCVLATSLARRAGRDVVEALSATRLDPRLARGADRQSRAALVAGRFVARGRLAGARLVLVDDVVTTGATLREASAVLEAAGAFVVPVALAATPG